MCHTAHPRDFVGERDGAALKMDRELYRCKTVEQEYRDAMRLTQQDHLNVAKLEPEPGPSMCCSVAVSLG